MPHKIAITGHRKLLNEDEVRSNIALSFQRFKEKYIDIVAVSALAEGADSIFIQEANKQNIPVKYILPFDLEEYKKDFSLENQKVLEELIKKNLQYETVKTLKTNSPQERNEAYLAVGKKLVDECDILVAVWDGKQAQGTGGTGDVVEYAKSKGKEMHIIKAIRPEKIDEVKLLFDTLDKSAKQYKEFLFQPAWYLGLLLAIIGVFYFGLGLAFHKSYLTAESKLSLAGFEVLCILISALLILFVARPSKDKFLFKRRTAEYLRTLLWFRDAGIPLPNIDLEDDGTKNKAKHPFEMLPQVKVIEADLKAKITSITNLSQAKSRVLSFTAGQIDYHNKTRKQPLQKKEKVLHFVLSLMKWIFYLSLVGKVFIEILHFLHELGNDFFHINIDFLLPYFNINLILTPSIFAVLETVRSFEEWKLNIEGSDKMVVKLSKIKLMIEKSATKDELLNATRLLRNELEKENKEWADRVASLTPGVHI